MGSSTWRPVRPAGRVGTTARWPSGRPDRLAWERNTLAISCERSCSKAAQASMVGTGIATFTDCSRDAVRGGGPFDADPRVQGFALGLFTGPNA
ncbi:hypothetical protein CG747_11225 [Streptomyces sp. CB02959]|nr:hypothetical protein CG747_11225 [Streptomyces sp. CB02959]